VEIEEHGLVNALRDFADTVEEIYGIVCTIKLDASVAVKDHIVASHLFRITQEAINNAVKHGKATAVTVSLNHGSGGRIILSIIDNGSGISLPFDKSDGMGLKIMRYRAKVIDGMLEISRHEHGGTQVICTFRHGGK
jgi:signal transduction histidine kinase